MGQPMNNVKILLRAVSTNQQIVQQTWSEAVTDSGGSYDFSAYPGKYAVFLEQRGKPDRLNNIYIYSDSAPGSLQSFMLAPSPDQLTPLMLLEVKASLEEATAAMLRARQWAENPINVPVLDFEQGAGPEYSAYHWAHWAMQVLDEDTNINWREGWNSATAYVFRDAVRYQGSSYYCESANTNQVPPPVTAPDNQYWSLMSERGGDGAASSLSIGTVNTVSSSEPASATITGTPPVQQLNLNIPAGKDGTDGTSPDMSNYYNKAEISNILNSYYTKQEIQVNYYNKAYIDGLDTGGGGNTVAGSVGSTIFAKYSAMDTQNLGGQYAGSSLIPCSLSITTGSGSDGSYTNPMGFNVADYQSGLAGTWQLLGSGDNDGASRRGALFQRIA
jgi:hypothetical protein